MEFVPKWIAWELTERCNLSCIHCRCSADMYHKDYFNTDAAFKLIDEIASRYNPVMVLTGGEPLLREDVFDIAKYGTDKGLRMAMATNGILVNDKTCEKIKTSGIKIVSLSLDGKNAQTHDDFRKAKGAFNGTVRAARLFKKHDIPFIINSSFTQRNKDDIPEVYKLAKSLGATAWYLFLIVPTGRGENLLNELVQADEYEEILKWHFDREMEENDILVRPTCAPQYYRIALQNSYRNGIKYKRRNLKFSTGGSKGCLAGQLIALITANGDVKPCSYFLRSAGNVFKTPFHKIWEESKIFRDMRDFKSYKGKCGECEFLNVCGGCRARADAIYGDYMAEEPYCAYIPKISKKHSVLK